jgi:hypothetical protein
MTLKRLRFEAAILGCLFTCTATAQIFPDFQGSELLDHLVAAYKPAHVLDYNIARDTLFSRIYREGDSVACVYSGHRRLLPPGEDPSAWLYDNGGADGINTEHTYPRSKGADEGFAFSDLHHLFPTRTGVNEARGNDPFGEIPDAQTQTWYYRDQAISTMPSMALEQYSEKKSGVFEPREDHKGNVARAMFYFYTMYKAEADAADPQFFSQQRFQLCQWHYIDPADSLETVRTWQIAHYQNDKPNPFVLDCTLAARCFCADVVPDCPAVISEADDLPDEATPLLLMPNPSAGQFTLCADKPGEVTFYDSFGRLQLRRNWSPGDQLDAGRLPTGVYWLQFRQESRMQVVRLVKY